MKRRNGLFIHKIDCHGVCTTAIIRNEQVTVAGTDISNDIMGPPMLVSNSNNRPHRIKEIESYFSGFCVIPVLISIEYKFVEQRNFCEK